MSAHETTLRAAEAVTDFEEDLYLTYPHSNGFIEGGAAVVLGRVREGRLEMVRHGLTDGARRVLCSFPAFDGLSAPPYSTAASTSSYELRSVFWDVALEAPVLAINLREGTWVADLERGGEPERVYVPPAGHVLADLCSLSADGKRILAHFNAPDRRSAGAVEIDRATGRVTTLFRADWWVGHVHYCPFDEKWIGYCHEGQPDVAPDRIWALHCSSPAEGKPIFEQHWNDPERRLYVGHERWCFHAPSVLAVAYGVSPGGPRGIYEAFADGRPSRLVSEGDRDWHVGVSRDGRWAVVDTTGPHDLPGKGWDNAGSVCDIVLLDMETGCRLFVARTRHVRHPSHPHPVFSPDGKFVYYNETDEPRLRNRVMRVRNPWAD